MKKKYFFEICGKTANFEKKTTNLKETAIFRYYPVFLQENQMSHFTLF